MHAIEVCRTATLGGHRYKYSCDHVDISYNSCPVIPQLPQRNAYSKSAALPLSEGRVGKADIKMSLSATSLQKLKKSNDLYFLVQCLSQRCFFPILLRKKKQNGSCWREFPFQQNIYRSFFSENRRNFLLAMQCNAAPL